MSLEGYLKPTLEELGSELIPAHLALNEATYPLYMEVSISLANLKQAVTSLNLASNRDLLKAQNRHSNWTQILAWYLQLSECDEKETVANYLKIVDNLNGQLKLFQKNLRNVQEKRYEYRTRSKDFAYIVADEYYPLLRDGSYHVDFIDDMDVDEDFYSQSFDYTSKNNASHGGYGKQSCNKKSMSHCGRSYDKQSYNTHQYGEPSHSSQQYDKQSYSSQQYQFVQSKSKEPRRHSLYEDYEQGNDDWIPSHTSGQVTPKQKHKKSWQ